MIARMRIFQFFEIPTTWNAFRNMAKQTFIKEPIKPVPGVRASLIKQFTEDDVKRFSAMMKDDNPIHLDKHFVERTGVFERPIVHSSLICGVVATLIGSKLPGPGSVIIMQTARYPAPLYVGDEMRAEVIVSAVKTKFVDLSVECTNMTAEENKTIMLGKITVAVMNKDLICEK